MASQLYPADFRSDFYKTAAFFLQTLDEHIAQTKNLLRAQGYVAKADAVEMPSTTDQLDCIEAAWDHFVLHINRYSIKQNSVDAYKVAAWMGLKLWHKTQKFPPLTLCNAMNFLLHSDKGRLVPKDIVLKISKMLRCDKSQAAVSPGWVEDDFAVGMNGLYMIFRACSKVNIPSCPAGPPLPIPQKELDTNPA